MKKADTKYLRGRYSKVERIAWTKAPRYFGCCAVIHGNTEVVSKRLMGRLITLPCKPVGLYSDRKLLEIFEHKHDMI